MTPQERKGIIHRPWTFEEAQEVSKHIHILETEGAWDLGALPEVFQEYAKAVSSHPAACLNLAKTKIIEAYEAHMGLNPPSENYTFTLDGEPEPVDLGAFLVDNEPEDHVVKALYALSPGETYTHETGWAISRVR